MTRDTIRLAVTESIETKHALLESDDLLFALERFIVSCCHAIRNGKKILICGNGGSAADAQHIAAELSGRFYYDRPPIDAEALHVNSSYLTAVANDYGYTEVFSRLLKAKGKPGDILLAISTSGNSPNVLRAVETAKEMGITVGGLTGQGGGEMRHHCDYLFAVPSRDTARIQECHILLGHIICQQVEAELFPQK